MTTPADEPVTEAGEQTADSVDPIVGTDDDLAPEQAAGVFDDVYDDLDPETAADTVVDDLNDDSEVDFDDDSEVDFDDDSEVDFDEPGLDDTAYDRIEPAKARIPPARSPAPMDRPFDTDEELDFVPHRRGRGGFDPEADAIARATRYTFRQRAVLALLLGIVGCGGLAVAIAPGFWWGTALTATVLVAYLAYLRRQVQMEEDIRRRRSARLNREREHEHEDEPKETKYVSRVPQRGMDRDTARELRRRSELLDFDDEDPLFEHLDPYDATAARLIRHRAEGGDVRRAAGA